MAQKIKYLVSVFIFLFFIHSCTVYYKTSDLRNNIKSVVNQMNANMVEVNSDYEIVLQIYLGIKKNVIDHDESSFKKIKNIQSSLDYLMKKIEKQQGELILYSDTIEKLVKGKKQIKSSDKAWAEIKLIRTNLKSQINKIQDTLDEYTTTSNAYKKEINKDNYKKINLKKFNQQINDNKITKQDFYNNLVEQLQRVRKETLNAYENNLITEIDHQTKLGILSEIEEHTNNIQTMLANIQSSQKEFNARTLNKNFVWVGENTKLNHFIDDLELNINVINEIYKEIKILQEQLQ